MKKIIVGTLISVLIIGVFIGERELRSESWWYKSANVGTLKVSVLKIGKSKTLFLRNKEIIPFRYEINF